MYGGGVRAWTLSWYACARLRMCSNTRSSGRISRPPVLVAHGRLPLLPATLAAASSHSTSSSFFFAHLPFCSSYARHSSRDFRSFHNEERKESCPSALGLLVETALLLPRGGRLYVLTLSLIYTSRHSCYRCTWKSLSLKCMYVCMYALLHMM